MGVGLCFVYVCCWVKEELLTMKNLIVDRNMVYHRCCRERDKRRAASGAGDGAHHGGESASMASLPRMLK
jgi:hypothetical protein